MSKKLSQEFFVLCTFPAVNLRGSLTITTSYAVVWSFFSIVSIHFLWFTIFSIRNRLFFCRSLYRKVNTISHVVRVLLNLMNSIVMWAFRHTWEDQIYFDQENSLGNLAQLSTCSFRIDFEPENISIEIIEFDSRNVEPSRFICDWYLFKICVGFL